MANLFALQEQFKARSLQPQDEERCVVNAYTFLEDQSDVWIDVAGMGLTVMLFRRDDGQLDVSVYRTGHEAEDAVKTDFYAPMRDDLDEEDYEDEEE